MKYLYLAVFTFAFSCGSPKKTSTQPEETKTMEASESKTSKLLLVLNDVDRINSAKELIVNSGLVWNDIVFDGHATKIARIEVPEAKQDFWIQRLKESGTFSKVELNTETTITEFIKEAKAVYLSIRNTECLGDCPVYNISINKEGEATYEGFKFVSQKGRKTFQLTDVEFDVLKEKLNSDSFATYKNVYDNPRLMDLPSTFIKHNGKQIKVRLWSDEVPMRLVHVNEYVQDLLISRKFISL